MRLRELFPFWKQLHCAQMSDVELQALTALVNDQTALINADVERYGSPQCKPCRNITRALEAELVRRGILPGPEEVARLEAAEAKAAEEIPF